MTAHWITLQRFVALSLTAACFVLTGAIIVRLVP